MSKDYQVEGAVQEIFQQTSTLTDIYDNVYQAGATINANGDYDILVKKWDEYGILQWTVQLDGNAEYDDFATDMLIDDSLNVYVVGGITNDMNDSLDAAVIKIDPYGNQLWTLLYDGSIHNSDIGTAINRDDSNNFYITGSTFVDSLRGFNTLAIKFNSSGNILWSNAYDHDSLANTGLKIVLDPLSGNVSIIGMSYTSSVSDFYYVTNYEVNKSTGILVGQSSVPNMLDGFVLDIKDIKRVATGEIYLTGTSIDTSTNEEDIVLVKLSSFLTKDWMVTYNGPDSLEDGGHCLHVDDSGNVYVSGYVGTADRGKDMIVLKYSTSGSLIWQETFKGPAEDIGNKLTVNSEGFVFAVGHTVTATSSDVLVLAIRPDGHLVWFKSIDGDHHNRDLGTGVIVDSENNLLVNAKVELGTVNQFTNIIIKYDVAMVPLTVVEVDSTPHHIASQVLISFNPGTLLLNEVDNTEKTFGVVGDFVSVNTIDSIESLLGGDPGFSNWRLIKINPNFTSADSVGYDINGQQIRLLPVFNDFILILPSSYTADSLVALLDSNLTLEYCGLNHIGGALTNDESYPYQTGLYFSDSEGNHINIPGAWLIEDGHHEIHVGIFDSGINFKHKDFDIGNLSIGIDESVIVDGLRHNGSFIRIAQDNDHVQTSHGTIMAGIVGAVKGNGKNVAGIAGGDFEAVTAIQGVSLFSLVMLGPGNYATEDNTQTIMNESQRLFNLHINNYSWQIPTAEPKSQMAKSVYNTFRLKRIQVAAAGNVDTQYPFYPGAYADPWILKVGATRKDPQNDKPIRYIGFDEASSFGYNLDVMAPGVEGEFVSLSWNDDEGTDGQGRGTSIAAPHVTGLAALVQSHVWRKNAQLLHQEDIEYLIQNNARDIVDINDAGCVSGPDIKTGFGIIDGTATMLAIEWPEYQIWQHELKGGNCSSTKINSSLITVNLEHQFFSLAPGTYKANIYKVSGSRSHFATQQGDYLDSWIRFSGSKGIFYNEITAPTTIQLHDFNSTFASFSSTPTTTNASLYTYMVEIVKKNDVDLPNPVFYPAPQAEITMAYSIYVHDVSATVGLQTPQEAKINAFPNPNSGDQLFLSVTGVAITDFQVEIFNLEGKLLSTEILSQNQNALNTIGISTLAKGMYLLRVSYNQEQQTIKFVKN